MALLALNLVGRDFKFDAADLALILLLFVFTRCAFKFRAFKSRVFTLRVFTVPVFAVPVFAFPVFAVPVFTVVALTEMYLRGLVGSWFEPDGFDLTREPG